MFEAITSIFTVLAPIIIGFAETYPVIFVIIFFMGTARLFIKPFMAAAETYIASTPTKSDDKFMAKVKENVIYKIFIFLIDWAASVKLPKKG